MSKAYIATNTIQDAHKSDIYAVVSCEAYTISGSGDGEITLWPNDETDPRPTILKKSAIGIHHLAIDNGGKILCAVGFDGRLQLYDLQKLQPIEADGLYSESTDSWAVAISQELPLLAVSTIIGSIKVWDLNTFKLVGTYSTNKKGFGTSVDISSDGSLVACGFDNGGIYMYNVQSGRLVYSFPGHSSAIRAIKFSPKGSLLAAAGDSKIIALYSTASGEHVTNLSGHTSWIFALDWNETGAYLLSVSYDGKCKIWSIESRSCVATQSESTGPLLCGKWMNKGWGKGILGGYNEGFITVGIEKAIRWFREASGQ